MCLTPGIDLSSCSLNTQSDPKIVLYFVFALWLVSSQYLGRGSTFLLICFSQVSYKQISNLCKIGNYFCGLFTEAFCHSGEAALYKTIRRPSSLRFFYAQLTIIMLKMLMCCFSALLIIQTILYIWKKYKKIQII